METKFRIAMNPSVGRHMWFTSDPHYGHANIIKYCNRPFADPAEMDRIMIANHNAVVKPDDIVFFLGDFAMPGKQARPKRDIIANYLSQLNGEKYGIFGNHDENGLEADVGLQRQFFKSMDKMMEIKVEVSDGDTADKKWRRIVLCHYKMEVWNKAHHGAWHLYGHSHGSMPEREDYAGMDVGVDPTAYRIANGYHFYPREKEHVKPWLEAKKGALRPEYYRPLGFYEVSAILSKRRFTPVDHHGMAEL